ncbi:unnamed protein product [Closterium sp. NIES-54]
MALRLSPVPLRVPLPPPPASSLRAASATVPRLLATIVTDSLFESIAASALVVELVDFAVACHLDYATSLVGESESDCPPSVGGECALGTDVLEDRQEDLECLAATVPHLVAMLLARIAMDADMASWKSTRNYVDVIPPSGANIVDGMWIFWVKRPPGSPPVFKARYIARGFSLGEYLSGRYWCREGGRHRTRADTVLSPAPEPATAADAMVAAAATAATIIESCAKQPLQHLQLVDQQVPDELKRHRNQLQQGSH